MSDDQQPFTTPHQPPQEVDAVPEAFRYTLQTLQHFVPRWAHLSNHTSSPASAAAGNMHPTGNPSYASTGDLRVLCAMGGGVGPSADASLREFFFTEPANPKSEFSQHADDLLFVVVPGLPPRSMSGGFDSQDSSSSPNNNSSSGAAGAATSNSEPTTVSGKVAGAFKSLFRKVSDKFSSNKNESSTPPAVVQTPAALLAQQPPAPPPPPLSASLSSSSSTTIGQQQRRDGFDREPSSPISPSSPIMTTVPHLCADAADPVVAGEQAVKGSTVMVLRRGIAPLQPVVERVLNERPPSRRNSFVEDQEERVKQQKQCGNNNNAVDDISGIISALNNVAPQLGLPREPNWFATIALNLACQWPYFLNVAVVKMLRVKELSPNGQAVPVAIRTVQRQVYPTLNPPRNLRKSSGHNLRDAGEDGNNGKLEYPEMHYTVDDFEDAFGDIRLAPGHKLAVLLTAGRPPANHDESVAVFRGVVNYDNLVQQLMRQEKVMGKSLVHHQSAPGALPASASVFGSSSSSSSGVSSPAVVPLKSQSGRAEVAIWLTEADIVNAQQRAQLEAALGGGSTQNESASSPSNSSGNSSKPTGTWLQGNEILHCALTRVSLHCAHVVSAMLQGVPWHNLHASWLPKQSAAPSKTRWMVFPQGNEQLARWLEEDVATLKSMGLQP